MGFSWSLYLVQKANELRTSTIPSLQCSELITDRGKPVVFPVPDDKAVTRKHYVYVDNLGILSPDRAIVKDSLGELDEVFSKDNLLLHPGEIHEDRAQALGCELDCRALCSRVTPARLHKVRSAIQAVLSRDRVSGKLLEIVIGHATFCGLACRPLLSIFHSVYRFIQGNYYENDFLWKSARDELRAFVVDSFFVDQTGVVSGIP